MRSLTLRLFVVTVALSVAAHAWALESKTGAPEDQFLKLVGDGIKKIQELCPPYFSKVANERLFETALNGILREIDPSGSSYVVKKDSSGAEVRFSPQVRVRLLKGVPTIASVIVHSEAFTHNVRQGDILLRIDGKQVLGQSLPEITQVLSGTINTTTTVAVFRPSTNTYHEETLKRESVESAVYTRKVAGRIGYVQINQVDDRSIADFEARLKALAKEKLAGLVIDLRNTVGGKVEHAVRLADPFLPDKDKVVAKVQDLQGVRSLTASAKTTHIKLPIVVLQNMGTQGAAEIVAAALQENHRAVLMGEQTYGSGGSEDSLSLSPDYVVHMATANVSTPSGKEIRGHGIAADILETTDSIPADKVKGFREEFTQFCKGIVVTVGTGAPADKKPHPTSSPASAPTTATSDEDEDEDDTAKKPADKGEKPKDQFLDEYPLVKRYDSTLLRAVNLLISTNIFYEQFLQN